MQHQDLAQGRWFKMTFAEQLGNVGSEFARVLAWKSRNNKKNAQSAMERFFELIDLSLSDNRWCGARRRELARAREQAAEEFMALSQTPENTLQRYFDHFARLARAGH